MGHTRAGLGGAPGRAAGWVAPGGLRVGGCYRLLAGEPGGGGEGPSRAVTGPFSAGSPVLPRGQEVNEHPDRGPWPAARGLCAARSRRWSERRVVPGATGRMASPCGSNARVPPLLPAAPRLE